MRMHRCVMQSNLLQLGAGDILLVEQEDGVGVAVHHGLGGAGETRGESTGGLTQHCFPTSTLTHGPRNRKEQDNHILMTLITMIKQP